MDIAKFLRLAVLKKHLRTAASWLILNGSLLHRPKFSRSIFYNSVTLQGPSHRSSFFIFKSASLVLKRVPTCVRKPASQLSFKIGYSWSF